MSEIYKVKIAAQTPEKGFPKIPKKVEKFNKRDINNYFHEYCCTIYLPVALYLNNYKLTTKKAVCLECVLK